MTNDLTELVEARLQEAVNQWERGEAASPSIDDYIIYAEELTGTHYDDDTVAVVETILADGATLHDVATYLVARA